MAFYFQSSAANDLCYRAAIGREACRGLPGLKIRLRILNSGNVAAPRNGRSDHRRRHLGRAGWLKSRRAPAGAVDHRGRGRPEDLRRREPHALQAADARARREPVARRHDRRPVCRGISRTMDVGGSALHWGGVTNRFSAEDLRLKSLSASRSTGRSAGTSSSATTAKRSGASALPASRGRLAEDRRSEPPDAADALVGNLRQLKAWAEQSVPFWETPQAKNTAGGRAVCQRCNTCEIADRRAILA